VWFKPGKGLLLSKRKVVVKATKVCSPEFAVSTFVSTGFERHFHRKQPCAECPWRMDVPPGVFPAEAFRTSAPTAYDGAISTFGCHMSKHVAISTCAGFLLRHSENNIGIRLARGRDRYEDGKVVDGGAPVYPSYREMAVANGVSPDDPSLFLVRADEDVWDRGQRRWRRREPGDEE